MNTILKPLDIIFIYNPKSDLEELIASCGLNYHNILLNHVGLYIGNNQVIEANDDGVVITPSTDFCKGRVYVKRLSFDINKEQIDAVINKALSYLNKSYNKSYKDTEDSIYCSELIIRSFEALDKNLFIRTPITFNNHITKQLDEKWLNYYKSKEDIPEGDLGSHPVNIFVNPNLIDVVIS